MWKLFIYTFKLGTFTKLTAAEINGGALVHLNISTSASVSLLVLQHSLKSGVCLPFRQAVDRNKWELRYIHAIKHRCSLNIWRGNELCQFYWGSGGPGSQSPLQPYCAAAQGPQRWQNSPGVCPGQWQLGKLVWHLPLPAPNCFQENWTQILYT